MPREPRLRDYLTRDEVALLLRSAKKSRHGARNYAMILVAYRHGLPRRTCALLLDNDRVDSRGIFALRHPRSLGS